MESARRWLLPARPVLILLGILLLVAAAGKSHALLTRPIVLPTFWTSRWSQTAIVVGELCLGLWLLFGLYPRRAWLLALACFFTFFEINFYLLLVGEKRCPCFGSTGSHPGLAALLDLAAVTALLLCRPFPNAPEPTISSHPRRLTAFVVLFGLLGIPAVILLGGRIDSLILPELRQDHTLRERMAFRRKDPTNNELLAILQKNTGLSMTTDSTLANERPFAESVSFQNVSACSLMEQMIGKQSERSEWRKTEDGYRLARVPPLRAWQHWIIAASLFALLSATLVHFRVRKG